MSLKSTRWGLVYAFVCGLGLAFVPLFGTLGPESAVALGVLLPPFAAALGARSLDHARQRRLSSALAAAEGMSAAAALVIVASTVLALNALRVKTCDPYGGLTFIALGPLSGSMLASLVGAALAALLPSIRLATGLAVFVPFGAIAVAAYDFVSTPGIYAFGHFFGYFPGTFYDRRIDIPEALWSMRLADLTLGLGLFITTVLNARPDRIARRFSTQAPWGVALLALCATNAVIQARAAEDKGLRTSRANLEKRLGRILDAKRCRVVLPRELDSDAAILLGEDCDFRVAQLEAKLGVREDERITAFFFRSQQEKRALMGAARVYIAKPWRREVYLQLGEFPHAVLPHELAHIVARHAASGLFGVPGRLFGIIPEPTLVEGLAVALEPNARDELTPHQWAKAAHEAKVAPPLAALLGPAFFRHSQALAYTLSGSFLGFVLETRGSAVVRDIYRAGNVSQVLGRDFGALEREWLAWLAAVPLPERARALAEVRFTQPSVFSAVCPHEVERLGAELSTALGRGDQQEAEQTCKKMLAIDANDQETRATYASLLARSGQLEGARSEIAKLEGPKPGAPPTLARARLGLADAHYLRGEIAAAEQLYGALLNQPQGDAELRQIEVKLEALRAGPPLSPLVGQLLIATPGQPLDSRVAMYLATEIRKVATNGLGAYLEGRQLISAGRHELALPLIDEALRRGLGSRRQIAEARRMQGTAAYVAGKLEHAERAFRALAELEDASLSEQKESADWLARIAQSRSVER